MSKKSSIIDILEHEMNRIYFEATNLEKSKRIYSDIWNRFACLVCCKTYKDEIANILMRDYGFTDRSLAMRSINKVIFRHMRDIR